MNCGTFADTLHVFLSSAQYSSLKDRFVSIGGIGSSLMLFSLCFSSFLVFIVLARDYFLWVCFKVFIGFKRFEVLLEYKGGNLTAVVSPK